MESFPLEAASNEARCSYRTCSCRQGKYGKLNIATQYVHSDRTHMANSTQFVPSDRAKADSKLVIAL